MCLQFQLLWRLRQENLQFKAVLANIVRSTKKKEERPEAMAQELRIPVALLEDPDSFPAPIWYLTTL